MVPSTLRRYTLWQKTKRAIRRYREVIMIVLTLLMSIAFLLFGYMYAIKLELLNPQWFHNGF